MRILPTVIAMVLAAVSVGMMALVMRGGGLGGASGDVALTAPALEAIRGLPVDDIERITLRRADEPARVFERRDGRWWQTEPFAYPMEMFSIRQLALVAVLATREGAVLPVSLDETAVPDSLGLDPPRAALTYEWPGGRISVELGRLAGAGRGYLRPQGGDEVFSVEQGLHLRAIQQNPWEWRDRRLFRDVSVDADSIERNANLAAGQERLKVVRDRRMWRIVEPVSARAEPMALEQWLRGLETAQVTGFVVDQPDDLARFGLDAPPASVTLTSTRRLSAGADDEVTTEPVVQTVLIGNRVDATSNDRYAMIAGMPAVFRLSLEERAKLLPQLLAVVAQTASGVAPPDVKEILIQGRDDELRLELDLDQWKVASMGGRAADARAVNDLLRQLTSLRPEQIARDAFPVSDQVAVVSFFGRDGRPLDTVRIAREAVSASGGGGGRWILENGDEILRYYPATVTFRLTARDLGLIAPLPGN
jgi:hypothetical protein